MKNRFLYALLFLSFCAFSQEQKRDTLFIQYDDTLLTKKYSLNNYFYYEIKGTGITDSEFAYLEEEEIYTNLYPKKIEAFKKVLKKSNAYYEKDKLSDTKLVKYLGKYVLFLVKEKKFIKVSIVSEIE